MAQRSTRRCLPTRRTKANIFAWNVAPFSIAISVTRAPEIAMENGATFHAKMFADATYEGDLMAQAGVSYTWGREGVEEYHESLAGVREHTPLHQFRALVSPLDAAGKHLRVERCAI